MRFRATPAAPVLSSSSSSSVVSSSSSDSSDVAADTAIFLRTVSEFLGVVSPFEFERLTSTPHPDTGHYRVAEFDLTFRNALLADEMWEHLKRDAADLARAQEILEALAEEETIAFESEPESSSSNSSSSSEDTRCRIVRSAVVPYPSDNPVGYRLTVRCFGCDDPNIFLWRDDEPDALGNIRERSIAVCKPGDIVDFPVAAAEGFPAMYRRSWFDVVTADVDLLKSGWENILLEVTHLFETQAFFDATVTSTDWESVE